MGATEELERWISPNLLVEGGVVSRIRLGDLNGARRLFAAVRSVYNRPPDDLRRRLIESYVDQEGARASPTTSR